MTRMGIPIIGALTAATAFLGYSLCIALLAIATLKLIGNDGGWINYFILFSGLAILLLAKRLYRLVFRTSRSEA